MEQAPHSLETEASNHGRSSSLARTLVADVLRQQQNVGDLKKAKRDSRCLSLAAAECRTQAIGVMGSAGCIQLASKRKKRSTD
jgi:hypothetical protein